MLKFISVALFTTWFVNNKLILFEYNCIFFQPVLHVCCIRKPTSATETRESIFERHRLVLFLQDTKCYSPTGIRFRNILIHRSVDSLRKSNFDRHCRPYNIVINWNYLFPIFSHCLMRPIIAFSPKNDFEF